MQSKGKVGIHDVASSSPPLTLKLGPCSQGPASPSPKGSEFGTWELPSDTRGTRAQVDGTVANPSWEATGQEEGSGCWEGGDGPGEGWSMCSHLFVLLKYSWYTVVLASGVQQNDLVIYLYGTSLVAQMVKNLPAMWEIRVWSLGQEDPLEKEMATHSSVLAWKIPWTEEPGGLQSMGLQKVGHDWVTNT